MNIEQAKKEMEKAKAFKEQRRKDILGIVEPPKKKKKKEEEKIEETNRNIEE